MELAEALGTKQREEMGRGRQQFRGELGEPVGRFCGGTGLSGCTASGQIPSRWKNYISYFLSVIKFELR